MKKKNLTQKRTQSLKTPLFVFVLMALIMGGVLLFSVISSGLDFRYYLSPIAICALDALLLLLICFTNYRYRYSLSITITYVLLVVFCIVVFVVYQPTPYVIFSYVAQIAWILFHIIVAVMVLFLSLRASKVNSKMVGKAMLFVATGCYVIMGIYMAFVYQYGYFGQKATDEVRPILYAYDAESDAYIVRQIAEGYGNTVIIPEQFNGKDVKKIDCKILNDDSLEKVYLNCKKDVSFLNVDELSLNSKLNVYIPKDKYDGMRETLYRNWADGSNHQQAASLLNAMAPDGLADNQVYVSFTFTEDDVQKFDGYLPTWYGEKGDTFKVSDFAEDEDLFNYTNENNDEHLYWSYNNLEKTIFSKIVKDGQNLDGTKITESVQNAEFVFKDIYRVRIGSDNDARYEMADSHKFTTLASTSLDYRYVTLDTADALIGAVEGRTGFDMKWTHGSSPYNRNDFTSLKEVLQTNVDSKSGTILQIQPEWTLQAPTINFVQTNVTNNELTYGEAITLSSEAVASNDALSLRYEWMKGNSLAKEGATYSVPSVGIDFGGDYVLQVTAYSNELTSLTSTSRQTINVKVNKKQLPVTWTLPSDTVYNASDKPIQIAYDTNAVVGEDVISLNLSQDSVRNASNYRIDLTLGSDTNRKYYVVSQDLSRSITITPYEIAVNWNEASLTKIYDGVASKPTVDPMAGLGADGNLIINVGINVGGGKNAGSYDVWASTADTNYKLTDYNNTFVVQKRAISTNWTSTTELDYTGLSQGIEVVSCDNVVSGEESIVATDLLYDGYEVNVGTYDMTASLKSTSNYVLATPEDGVCQYEIKTVPLTINIVNKSKIYNGSKFTYSSYSFNYSGLVGPDTIGQVFVPTYKGTAIDAINVGDYEINATNNKQSKTLNYDITINKSTLTISQRDITITVNNVVKTYDAQIVTEFSIRGNNVASTDTLAEIVTIDDYRGAGTTATNQGSYEVEVDVYNAESKYANYNVTFVQGTVTINKKEIGIVWQEGRTFTYDGNEYGINVISVNDEIEGEEDGIISSISYNADQVNAGTYDMEATLPSDSNYTISSATKKQSYVINPQQITANFAITTAEYTAYSHSVDVTLSVSGLDYRVEYYANGGSTNLSPVNVGEYQVKAILEGLDANNYTIAVSTSPFSITAVPLTINIADVVRTYDGVVYTNFDYSTEDLKGADTLDQVVTNVRFSGTATTAKNVGTGYEINHASSTHASKYNNYVVTWQSAEMTINHREISLVWQSNKELEYKSAPQGVKVTNFNNVVNADRTALLNTLVYNEEQTNVGSYTRTVELPAGCNYVFSSSESGECAYTITTATLTVTAENKSKLYDGAIFSEGFTYAYSGLKGSDTIEEVLTKVDYMGTATTAVNAGSYAIQLGGFYKAAPKGNNYQFTGVAGTLTISKRTLTLTWSSTNLTYSGSEQGITVTSIANALPADESNILNSLTYTGHGTNANSYTMRATLDSAYTTNYSIANSSKGYVISPKAVTITFGALTHVFDNNPKQATATLSDPNASVTLTYFNGSYQMPSYPSSAGTYTVKATLTSTNYKITNSAQATLTIEKKEVTASVTDKTVNGNVVNMVVTLSEDVTASFVVTDDEGNAIPSYKYNVASSRNDEVYTLVISLTEAGNYMLKFSVNQTNYIAGDETVDSFVIVQQVED